MDVQALIPKALIKVIKQLSDNGHAAYIVGGAVRDILLNKELITDWDITTDATPQEVLKLLGESFYDNAFGTVMVAPKHVSEQFGLPYQYEGVDVFDITTFRTETGYSDSRRPDSVVWGTTLEEDVTRRDFTINALALYVSKQVQDEIDSIGVNDQGMVSVSCELIDHVGGVADLQAKLIRTVGNANTRFSEDALRMMRAIRIASQLSFGIEPDTLGAIRDQASLLNKISKERVRDELFKILASNYPADGILMLFSSGLLEYIIPELLESRNIKQGGHHIFDVWTHAIESLRGCPSSDPIVRFATLLHDVGKPRTVRYEGPRGVTFYGHEVVGARMAAAIAERLKLSKKQREKIFTLVRWHMFTYQPDMTDSAIRRFIRNVGVENINDMMMLRIGDRTGGGSKATSWRLRELQRRIGENLYEPLGLKDLAIDGNDLMEKLELKPGPVLGKILNQLFEEVMNDEIANEPEKLIERAREMVESSKEN